MHNTKRSLVALAVVVVATLTASACTAQPGAPGSTTTTVPGPTTAPTLTVSDVATGLNRPWDLAFAPDGTLLFTEKVGRIDAWIGGTKRVLATPSDVVVQSESGMMGLAVDPAFATNRRIYTCFLSNTSGSLDIRIARWVVDAGYTSLSGRTDILTGLPVNTAGQAGRHGGCRPRFGPDGNLWISTGDAATGSVPQDPNSLGGKVLRVTTSGAGAPGNPGGALRSEIYTLGHRNPQGVAFRSDGVPFSVEHGTGCDDEINRLVAGGNYGWHPVPISGGSTYDESRPMTDPARIPGALASVWSSGCPTIAPSGGTFLSGAQWEAWNGSLAIAVLKDMELFVATINPAGTALTQTSKVIQDRGRLRTAVQGPDGNLYLVTDADPGKILEVVPS